MLIEAAQFAPLSIRSTARKLKLHSPSSYRFERGTDPEMVDWASRRCCELILKHAGGELIEGVDRRRGGACGGEPITLRLAQLKRIIGIDVPPEAVRQDPDGAGLPASSRPDATKSSSFRRAGGAIWSARSTWSRKWPAFTATTRFPRTPACRWRPRTGPTATACWPRCGRC